MNWVIKLIDSHKQDAELDPFTIDEAVRIYRPNVKVKKDVNPVSSRNIICGSILGDIIGEPYEFANSLFGYKPENKLLYDSNTYTDDTILTLATLDAILHSNQYDDTYCISQVMDHLLLCGLVCPRRNGIHIIVAEMEL